MENHNFLWVNPLKIAIFNSFVYVYQRVPPIPMNSHHVRYSSGHNLEVIFTSFRQTHTVYQIQIGYIHIYIYISDLVTVVMPSYDIL